MSFSTFEFSAISTLPFLLLLFLTTSLLKQALAVEEKKSGQRG
jgi:hypothetical protein